MKTGQHRRSAGDIHHGQAQGLYRLSCLDPAEGERSNPSHKAIAFMREHNSEVKSGNTMNLRGIVI